MICNQTKTAKTTTSVDGLSQPVNKRRHRRHESTPSDNEVLDEDAACLKKKQLEKERKARNQRWYYQT